MANKMSLTFEMIYQELQREYDYLADGGTSYRVETATLALQLVKDFSKLETLLNREKMERIITTNYPSMDDERKKDVAKFLSVIAGQKQLEAEMSEEIKLQLEERRKNRKGFRLVSQSK